MNDSNRYPHRFCNVSLQAVRCNVCFVGSGLKRPTVDKAQPRWIGPGYQKGTPRVVFMLLNPGSGNGRSDRADATFRDLLHRFSSGENLLDAIMDHQRADISNWGRGRFIKFLNLASLDIDNIALMNVAWCATAQNNYPPLMLRTCLEKHTLCALTALEPNVIIILGIEAHRYASQIKATLPDTRVIRILHYAHRKGDSATRATAKEVNQAIKDI